MLPCMHKEQVVMSTALIYRLLIFLRCNHRVEKPNRPPNKITPIPSPLHENGIVGAKCRGLGPGDQEQPM